MAKMKKNKKIQRGDLVMVRGPNKATLFLGDKQYIVDLRVPLLYLGPRIISGTYGSSLIEYKFLHKGKVLDWYGAGRTADDYFKLVYRTKKRLRES